MDLTIREVATLLGTSERACRSIPPPSISSGARRTG